MNRSIPHILRFHVQANFEGWAAGIAAAGVAVSAGSAISSGVASSNAADAQQDLLNAQGKKPKIVPVDFEDPSKAYDEYYQQYQQQYPQLNKLAQGFNATDNADYQALLTKTSPSLMSGIATQGAAANALLESRLPKDVQSQVTRSAAYKGLANGYGANSGAGQAVTARDLGRTSLDLINQGSSLLGANITNTKAVNPYFFTGDSLMLTPQQFLSRDDSNAAYANGVANANNNITYQNSLYNTAANSYNPAMAGTSSAIGAAGGVVNSLGRFSSAYSAGGSPSVSGGYTTPGSNSYDVASSLATTGGSYNPYLDTNNYDEEGAFIGNASSYGGG